MSMRVNDAVLPRVDEHGQLLGIPCHDGALERLDFGPGDADVSFVVRSTEGVCHTIRLVGCWRFDASGASERNIIDRMYLWPLPAVPDTVLPQAAAALSVDPPFARDPVYAGLSLFMLECSYGVTIHALVERVAVE